VTPSQAIASANHSPRRRRVTTVRIAPSLWPRCARASAPIVLRPAPTEAGRRAKTPRFPSCRGRIISTVVDRGYIDFDRLGRFHETGSFFVIRAKTTLKAERRYSHAVDRSTGLVCNQTVTLAGFYSHKGFPAPLRRIRFKDPETGKRLVFLSNNFALPALTITKLYRLRWQIELFFKWIKQHLRIKAFFGTTENAVKTQIWIAVSVYVLVAIVKKRLQLSASLYEILQILSLTMFERMPIDQLLSLQPIVVTEAVSPNQLTLFD
jgi:hypothetical protein